MTKCSSQKITICHHSLKISKKNGANFHFTDKNSWNHTSLGIKDTKVWCVFQLCSLQMWKKTRHVINKIKHTNIKEFVSIVQHLVIIFEGVCNIWIQSKSAKACAIVYYTLPSKEWRLELWGYKKDWYTLWVLVWRGTIDHNRSSQSLFFGVHALYIIGFFLLLSVFCLHSASLIYIFMLHLVHWGKSERAEVNQLWCVLKWSITQTVWIRCVWVCLWDKLKIAVGKEHRETERRKPLDDLSWASDPLAVT